MKGGGSVCDKAKYLFDMEERESLYLERLQLKAFDKQIKEDFHRNIERLHKMFLASRETTIEEDCLVREVFEFMKENA
jgi:glutathionylspermidine synthase